jgi:biotin-dependent carboxylase-like uncharacterized protein
VKVSLHVIKPGSLTTIQDLGRRGVAQHGFTTAGAMDQYAARAANILVDNSVNSALLEVTLGGCQFEVDDAVDFAICGAEAPLQINQRYVESWRTHRLEAGDVLSIGFAQRGSRLYLAFAGGIRVEHCLASCSTAVREGLGGFHGRSLQRGDALELSPRAHAMSARRFSVTDRSRFAKEVTLYTTIGPQWFLLKKAEKQKLLQQRFTISSDCDRMGYRLSASDPLASLPGIISEGVGVGAVQLPNDGQPIIMMRDHQTMGGYPKPLVLLPESVDALSHCLPGDVVTFKLLTPSAGLARYQRYQQRLQKLPWEYV